MVVGSRSISRAAKYRILYFAAKNHQLSLGGVAHGEKRNASNYSCRLCWFCILLDSQLSGLPNVDYALPVDYDLQAARWQNSIHWNLWVEGHPLELVSGRGGGAHLLKKQLIYRSISRAAKYRILYFAAKNHQLSLGGVAHGEKRNASNYSCRLCWFCILPPKTTSSQGVAHGEKRNASNYSCRLWWKNVMYNITLLL